MKDNLVGFLALFVALGGTGAYAANTIRSTDIVDGEVKSADVANQDLTGGDIKDNSISSFDVASLVGDDVVNETLTGNDIKDGFVGGVDIADDSLGGVDIDEDSLVGLEDGCPPTMTLYLNLCARSDGGGRLWVNALIYCRDLGLRVPSLGEAIALGAGHDVPGVADGEAFWTDELAGTTTVYGATEEGGFGPVSTDATSRRTVCVTTPSSLYQ